MSQSPSAHLTKKSRTFQTSDSPLVHISALSPLDVPELLEMIIGNLAAKDIVLAARVCRTWSEPALDRIWREMRSLVPLFSLVRPMTQQSDGEWEFIGDIKDVDWARYAVYAPRIREVVVRDYDREAQLSTQAMRAISAHLPSHLQLPLPATIYLLATAPDPQTLLELPLISQSLRKLGVYFRLHPHFITRA
ncbi:hypothetical protein M407DRAFT_26082 [Tulasnella calospora MUT 4182]|uniref:F-box domain-containing protein n=1 Tax=Tulasnella calospora MUT 4182 TaxID=1051891 RepID=A0A0C3QGF0_9AGAM|nr:hypothetical protein M407DRAFT_26082 [Tulasnella calospora MUT 4182]